MGSYRGWPTLAGLCAQESAIFGQKLVELLITQWETHLAVPNLLGGLLARSCSRS
jgi:hypothetical protein